MPITVGDLIALLAQFPAGTTVQILNGQHYQSSAAPIYHNPQTKTAYIGR